MRGKTPKRAISFDWRSKDGGERAQEKGVRSFFHRKKGGEAGYSVFLAIFVN
jgi:hypothetical protein